MCIKVVLDKKSGTIVGTIV